MRLLIFFVLMLFILGCNSDPFNIKCHDDVRFFVTQPYYLDGDLCYSNNGNLEFMFFNYGNTTIEIFTFILEGSKDNLTINLTLNITPSNTRSVSINYLSSKLGTLKRVEILPGILFEDEFRTCLGNRVVKRDIGECY